MTRISEGEAAVIHSEGEREDSEGRRGRGRMNTRMFSEFCMKYYSERGDGGFRLEKGYYFGGKFIIFRRRNLN